VMPAVPAVPAPPTEPVSSEAGKLCLDRILQGLAAPQQKMQGTAETFS